MIQEKYEDNEVKKLLSSSSNGFKIKFLEIWKLKNPQVNTNNSIRGIENLTGMINSTLYKDEIKYNSEYHYGLSACLAEKR